MLRWTGILLVLAGVGLVISDLVNAGRLRDLGEWWFGLHPDSLQLLQPALERHLHPVLWDPLMLTLLTWPAAVEVLALGCSLFGLSLIFRR